MDLQGSGIVKSGNLLPKKVLDASAIERAIERIESRIADLRAFNVQTVPESSSPNLLALSAAVRDTLDRAFGEGTSAFGRFERATDLNPSFAIMTSSYPQPHHYREQAQKKISASAALLMEAQRTLREDLADQLHSVSDMMSPPQDGALSHRVFVVHGHDDAALQTIARFLEKLGLEPVILHEQANRGRTIITKFRDEAADIGFAVVLMTPDDQGAKAGAELRPRARQNVVFELGFFIGALGPEKVAALVKGDVERPSDFDGVVYILFEHDGWRAQLGRELQAAGYEIDWNRVMRA